MWAKLALKLFSREFKRGELTVISAAIALAVLTVLTLSMVTDRIGQSIEEKSSAFIAADRVLASNHVLPAEFLEKANQDNLRTAKITYFDTMLFAGDEMQLGSVKAVSNTYPLKGELKVKTSLTGLPEVTNDIPSRGEVWLSESVFYALNIKVGDKVELGAATFTASHVVAEEPDARLMCFQAASES